MNEHEEMRLRIRGVAFQEVVEQIDRMLKQADEDKDAAWQDHDLRWMIELRGRREVLGELKDIIQWWMK